MKYTVHYEETLEVEADTFQGARDRAIDILYQNAALTDSESRDCNIVCITDENDEEEPDGQG